jgi:hypothetical protein
MILPGAILILGECEQIIALEMKFQPPAAPLPMTLCLSSEITDNIFHKPGKPAFLFFPLKQVQNHRPPRSTADIHHKT